MYIQDQWYNIGIQITFDNQKSEANMSTSLPHSLRLYCDDKYDDPFTMDLEPIVTPRGTHVLRADPCCVLNFDSGEFQRLTFDLIDSDHNLKFTYVVTIQEALDTKAVLQKRAVRESDTGGPRLHLVVGQTTNWSVVIRDIEVATFQKGKRTVPRQQFRETGVQNRRQSSIASFFSIKA